MPVTFHYDPALHAVLVHLSGVVRNHELESYFARLASDDSILPGFVEVVDFSGADDFQLSYGDVQSFAQKARERFSLKGQVGIFFYAPTDLSYGMASMFKAYGDSVGIRVDLYRDWRAMSVMIGTRQLEDLE